MDKTKINKVSFNLDMRAVEGLHRYFIQTIEYADHSDPYFEDIKKIIVTLEQLKEKYE